MVGAIILNPVVDRSFFNVKEPIFKTSTGVSAKDTTRSELQAALNHARSGFPLPVSFSVDLSLISFEYIGTSYCCSILQRHSGR